MPPISPLLSLPSLLFTLILISFQSLVSPKYFTIRNNKFYTPQNAQMIFHGVNLVQKSFPYYKQYFDQKYMDKLQKSGINALRVGIMWPGVEPQDGVFNETYLDVMQNLVNKVGQYGMYSLLEFHQDLFSSIFCADGVPEWLIPQQILSKFPLPLQNIKNNRSVCQSISWQKIYFTYSVNQAFLQFYKNTNSMLDKFVRYWKKVAQKFKGNKYVIGYQLMNQPWPGNMYKQPYVMIPGISEMFHLQGMYDRVAKEIQAIDYHNIAVQPITWLNQFPIGLTHAPGAIPSDQQQSTSILSFHYYNPPILSMENFLYARKLDMQRLNMGGLLTQFYGITDEAYIDITLLDRCQQFGIGWFSWQFRPILLISLLKRTYAQRIAGIKKHEKFNNSTKSYQLHYIAAQGAGQTVIFFNYVHYLYGEQNVTDKQVNISLELQYDGQIVWDELNIEVEVFPRNVQYEVRKNMYFVISSKGIDKKMIIFKVKRKVNYQNEGKSVEEKKVDVDQKNHVFGQIQDFMGSIQNIHFKVQDQSKKETLNSSLIQDQTDKNRHIIKTHQYSTFDEQNLEKKRHYIRKSAEKQGKNGQGSDSVKVQTKKKMSIAQLQNPNKLP